MFTTNFVCIATKSYTKFILPYAVSALITNKNSCVEIVVDNVKQFTPKVYQLLDYYFKGRYMISSIVPDLLHNFTGPTIRWLYVPKMKAKYTYIGDVDIVCIDKDIFIGHEKHMQYINKPYSNIIRYPTKQMTGLHFVNTVQYFTSRYIQFITKLINQKTKSIDETLLYKIVRSTHGLPTQSRCVGAGIFLYRPVHGIHFSPHRLSPSLNIERKRFGASPRRIKGLNILRSTSVWKSFERVFDPGYASLISKICKVK
jgi:hypothetical protein